MEKTYTKNQEGKLEAETLLDECDKLNIKEKVEVIEEPK